MKRFFCVFVIIIIALICNGHCLCEDNEKYIALTSTDVQLRSKPNGSRMMTVPEKSKVKILDWDNEWSYITYNGKRGYCKTEYLYSLRSLDPFQYLLPLNPCATDGYVVMRQDTVVRSTDFDGTTLIVGDVICAADNIEGGYDIFVWRDKQTLEDSIAEYHRFTSWEEATPGDIIGGFSTFFSRSQGKRYPKGRETNIKLGCTRINDLTLQSGERFSFNQICGPYQKSNGYKLAPNVSYEGKGYGGGICQVTTTLYNAILTLPIKINQWSIHRYSGVCYVPQFYDAAVGKFSDFVFTNTLPYAITIKAAADNGVINVFITRAGIPADDVEDEEIDLDDIEYTIDDQPTDFILALQEYYVDQGCEIISASACGQSGAAIIKGDTRCFLSVLSLDDHQWSVMFENENAVYDGSSVFLDTDAVLILSNPSPICSEYQDQFYFIYETDWTLSSAIRYEEHPYEDYIIERMADFSDGVLKSAAYYTDTMGNILLVRDEAVLPDVLTAEEKLLSSFDGTNPPINGNGYFTYDDGMISNTILTRVFDDIIPASYTWVDGISTNDGLQFIADKPDGSRVLLCCSLTDDQLGWQITESTPLPEKTTIGIENFTTTINLGQMGNGVSISRNNDDSWSIREVLGNELIYAGGCWVNEGGLWWNASTVIGNNPWNDITQINWSSIPHTKTEAKSMVDTSHWATPNNAYSQDGLTMWEKPCEGCKSLGEYYYGTPIRVLSYGDTWTNVSIGGIAGYMETKCLWFGDAINAETNMLVGKPSVKPVVEVLWNDADMNEKITSNEASQLLIIGVINDEWYLVWNPYIDRYGQIKQTNLWDGNG